MCFCGAGTLIPVIALALASTLYVVQFSFLFSELDIVVMSLVSTRTVFFSPVCLFQATGAGIPCGGYGVCNGTSGICSCVACFAVNPDTGSCEVR